MTSKDRALLRAQANTLDTTLIVGKNGVSDEVIAEAEILLSGKELVKGKVLETALLSAREASDAICDQTGAEGVGCVGNKFIIYRKSEKAEKEKPAKAPKAAPKKKVNPVKLGIKARKQEAKAARERRKKYYHDAAVQAAIDRRKDSAQ